MPEAPEVHELASFLDARASGRRIVGVDVALGKIVKTPDAGAADLVGATVTGVTRIAKMIDIAVLDAAGAVRHVIVHFGHDGWVIWHDVVPAGITRAGEATLMARVRLDDGTGFDLTDSGQWKALTIHVVDRASDVPAVAKLGPDALDPGFALDRFAGILVGRKKQIKALIQDQTAVAGIGNAYSDEILHAARISPVTHAAVLSDDEVATLYAAMRGILLDATAARRGVPPADLKAAKRAALTVHRRTGERCPVCGDTIREMTFSGASAQYCPTCQTGGVALDR
ncbi:MAG TPA: DNA-formamidopyrimidine glycosylase family protein [Microbacterium sp.]|uniref:Fpg/Nei family DNA glycosylase n=1 Tax=Microbacterium sp. TaxID=51671 RepID=UPI002B611EB5|nr:DNA-formamidopyrimidine glycosylase family protein [Microbacterium sp.]HWI32515.1 DNA-formamidopyrimidine glycosylase family protein [Microbacterium sp.]